MAERGLDKFLEEATYASPSYSFQEWLAVPASRATCAVCHDTTPVAPYSLSGLAPRLTNAILLAERFRLALGKSPNGSSVFTSCDESGKLLKGHTHHTQRVQLRIGQGSGGGMVWDAFWDGGFVDEDRLWDRTRSWKLEFRL